MMCDESHKQSAITPVGMKKLEAVDFAGSRTSQMTILENEQKKVCRVVASVAEKCAATDKFLVDIFIAKIHAVNL